MNNTTDSNLTDPPCVLVVDDDPISRRILFVMLGKLGFLADMTESGKEALHRLRQHHYKLVFMDHQLPDMDGCTVTRLLRDPLTCIKNPAIPVIGLTASESKQECLHAGMNDFMIKPITKERLSATLKNWLQQSQPEPVDNDVPNP